MTGSAGAVMSEQDPVRDENLRSPDFLMNPERLVVQQPSRLSISRAVMSIMMKQKWKIERVEWNLDENGAGNALYRVTAGTWVFDFPVLALVPSSKRRTGRIIGQSWDMIGALIEGPVSREDIEINLREMPKLYEGRATPGTLAWGRSNKSSRIFEHTIESLAAGQQPDIEKIADVCYLMRNTGLDGNGTFGTKSFLAFEDDHPLRLPLAAQVLAAYLMREYSFDLVHHLAKARGGETAVELDSEIRRFIGLGNGSALGLVLFSNNRPVLLDSWLKIREQALAKARSLRLAADSSEIRYLRDLLNRCIRHREQDRMPYTTLASSSSVAESLRGIVAVVEEFIETGCVNGKPSSTPCADIADIVERQAIPEAAETFNALIMDLVADYADGLLGNLIVDEDLLPKPEQTVDALKNLIRNEYAWAFEYDVSAADYHSYVWYKSRNSEEPRRGRVSETDGAHNLGLDLPALILDLDKKLGTLDADMTTGHFLAIHPELRQIVSRVQSLAGRHYHSPHANIMGEGFVPIEIIRLYNVAFHGIDKTRDYLGRNLRGVLLHGAPSRADLERGENMDEPWFFPAEPMVPGDAHVK